MTGTFGALAKAGIVLERQHSYKYCSPTRRSSAPASALPPARCGSRLSRPVVPAVLSGRFPVHITGTQAPVCSNYLPLQFSILPKKLKELGGYEVRSRRSARTDSGAHHASVGLLLLLRRRTWSGRVT